MFTPIIEYKLCKNGKKLYKELYSILKNSSLKKIELNPDEYDFLLKGIPLHRQNDYINNIPFGSKLIVRRNRNG